MPIVKVYEFFGDGSPTVEYSIAANRAFKVTETLFLIEMPERTVFIPVAAVGMVTVEDDAKVIDIEPTAGEGTDD